MHHHSPTSDPRASTAPMASRNAIFGDWTCYSNDTKELQTHNASHRKPQTKKKPPTLRSKLKRAFTSPFRKSRPHTTEATSNEDDENNNEWTCHDRKLMRYTNPPLGNQTIITGGANVGDDAATMAKKREQYNARSTTLVGGDDCYSYTTVHLPIPGERRVHDHANTNEGASSVPPPLPDRNTVRMTRPTSPVTPPGEQAVPRSWV